MKLKSTLIALAVMVSAASATAAETNYLHVITPTGWEIISLDEADALLFDGNQMKVVDAAGSTVKSFDRAELKTLMVNQSTGVNTVGATDTKASFQLAGNTLTALCDGDFSIFSLSGEKLVEIPAVKEGQTVELSGVAAGIYVVRLGAFSAKVSVK